MRVEISRNTFSDDARTLDICVRYTHHDDVSHSPKWMTISIPRIIPIIKDLSIAQKPNIGLCNNTKMHNHDFDNCNLPCPLPNNFKILKDSFPLLCLDQPFYSSPPFFTCALSSACIGSIIYCLGGDSDDIVDGLQEIYNDLPPPPPPLECIPVEAYPLWENSEIDKIYITETEPQTTVKAKVDKVDGGGICHKFWFRDMSKPDSEWREGTPLISPRLFPHLVSYQGKLYAFGGNRPSDPFAEVYDPKSEIWTLLEPPPFGRLSYAEFLVVPLKGWNRLWLFSLHRDIDYTYDVRTGNWQKFKGANDIIHRFKKQSSIASFLTTKKHVVVYWVNYKGEVYAYNLSTRVLYKGTVNGLRLKKNERQEGMYVSLSHLYGDIFCLIGREVRLTGCYETIIHVTLLQISLTAPPNFHKLHQMSGYCPPKPLSAVVLACFAYPFLDYIDVTHAYIM
ncbi:uncharacterized protein LOC141615350 isoform X2 [Silene latifolia]|uniref:uncharacterized protein LOC141615350 isoform X2 n=1 Tax=Silene latifolia TaxID=37657 RepID=UPI003D76AA25